MLLFAIRRISLQPSSYFLLPLRGVASPGSFLARRLVSSPDMPPPKPPNVLVFTNEEHDSDQSRFNAVKETLNMCLSPDYYTVYLLSEQQVKSTPWLSNTMLLIVACKELSYTTTRIFTEYLLRGGSLLVMASRLCLPGVTSSELSAQPRPVCVNYEYASGAYIMEGQSKYSFDSDANVRTLASDQEGRSLMFEMKLKSSRGVALLSQIHLEYDPVFFSPSEDVFALLKKSNETRISIFRHILSTRFHLNCDARPQHKLSLGHIFSANKVAHDNLLSRIQSCAKNGTIVDNEITFRYITEDQAKVITPTTYCLPVVLSSSEGLLSRDVFNSRLYFAALKTHNLGHALLFVENVTTTMTAVKALCNTHGSVAVATRQLNGKGRGGNAWLGPAGCAMFTVCLHIPLHSPLGQRSPFVQHLAALALAKAVRNTEGYEGVNIRVKWPNDIYYETHAKIGGILVTSTVSKDTITCYIGCGMNVSNSQPTLCINDIAKVVSRNARQECPRPLTSEEVIAKALNELEFLVATFQGGGVNMILQDYYRYWLHGGQVVTLQTFGSKALIKGLDEYGYLVAVASGKEYKLQPDGNSFDLMNNLIVMKA
ncbi:unnamed protein product [Ixodes persulcatus]